jgi:hypothetical protein
MLPAMLRAITLGLAAGLFALGAATAAEFLAPGDAILHVGKTARVCGAVVTVVHAPKANGQPTFINFGKPYPDQDFTALIWGSSRPAFPYAPESLRGQTVCVRGRIAEYRGKAQIVVSDPSQLERSP